MRTGNGTTVGQVMSHLHMLTGLKGFLYLLGQNQMVSTKSTCSNLHGRETLLLTLIFLWKGSLLLESKIQPDTAYQKQQVSMFVFSRNKKNEIKFDF